MRPLAIENTMISHTPEVQEQLDKFGIPVLIDHSSYEPNPLGRTEWVKLYGLLTGHEEEAEAAFASEADAFKAISGEEATGKTVAFFYITCNWRGQCAGNSGFICRSDRAGGRHV